MAESTKEAPKETAESAATFEAMTKCAVFFSNMWKSKVLEFERTENQLKLAKLEMNSLPATCYWTDSAYRTLYLNLRFQIGALEVKLDALTEQLALFAEAEEAIKANNAEEEGTDALPDLLSKDE